MKKFTFKGVLDGFRSSVSQQARADQEIVETLRPDNFQVAKVGQNSLDSLSTGKLCVVGEFDSSLQSGRKNKTGPLSVLGWFLL